MNWQAIFAWLLSFVNSKTFWVGVIVFLLTSIVWLRLGSFVRRAAVDRAWRQCIRQYDKDGGGRGIFGLRGQASTEAHPVEYLFATKSEINGGGGSSSSPAPLWPVFILGAAALCACVALFPAGKAQAAAAPAFKERPPPTTQEAKDAFKVVKGYIDDGSAEWLQLTLADAWHVMGNRELTE